MATKKVASKKTVAPAQAATETEPTPKKTAASKKTASKTTQMAPAHRDIERLAYELWEHGGKLHGDDAQHWLRAEHQLKSMRPN